MRVIIRNTEGHKFYANVHNTKEEAAATCNEEWETPIKTFAKFGDPADGWMVHTPFGFREDGKI